MCCVKRRWRRQWWWWDNNAPDEFRTVAGCYYNSHHVGTRTHARTRDRTRTCDRGSAPSWRQPVVRQELHQSRLWQRVLPGPD